MVISIGDRGLVLALVVAKENPLEGFGQDASPDAKQGFEDKQQGEGEEEIRPEVDAAFVIVGLEEAVGVVFALPLIEVFMGKGLEFGSPAVGVDAKSQAVDELGLIATVVVGKEGMDPRGHRGKVDAPIDGFEFPALASVVVDDGLLVDKITDIKLGASSDPEGFVVVGGSPAGEV